MLLNWNEHRDELLGKVNEFAKLTPEFMRGLVKMDAGASATIRRCCLMTKKIYVVSHFLG